MFKQNPTGFGCLFINILSNRSQWERKNPADRKIIKSDDGDVFWDRKPPLFCGVAKLYGKLIRKSKNTSWRTGILKNVFHYFFGCYFQQIIDMFRSKGQMIF